MSRFAATRQVYFFEEPVFEELEPYLRAENCPRTGVRVVTPVLPHGLSWPQISLLQKELLSGLVEEEAIQNYIAWYYTPMALEFSSEMKPAVTIYDCMDELSAFAGAPPAMRTNEENLFRRADLVFTGGASLYESKKKQHDAAYLFPSSVDVAHFSQARAIEREPEDQARIRRPRLGYAGVIDERMDLDLLAAVAAAKPNWQIVLLGPVVKVNPDLLPRAANIHYLGMKAYSELPAYFSGWDIGLLPFALNESTRFISPTKTPEYLAAGLRVVSTPIRDVVTPYGDLGLVTVVSGAREFVSVTDVLLNSPVTKESRTLIDSFLSQSSWDKTWRDMSQLIETNLTVKRLPARAHQFQTAGVVNAALKGLSNV